MGITNALSAKFQPPQIVPDRTSARVLVPDPPALYAHVQMAAPLGFEPSRPSSKPGALPARRRGNTIGATCGIRTRATRFEGPGSWAARRTWRYGADGENRTRVFCLEGSGSAVELRPRGGWCRDRTCATLRSRRVSTALPCRSANHPLWSPRSESNTRPAV